MTSSNDSQVESRGPTVEAAISAGLQRLGAALDQVTVTVIDEGSRGLLGIGSRDAVVQLTMKSAEPEVLPSSPTEAVGGPRATESTAPSETPLKSKAVRQPDSAQFAVTQAAEEAAEETRVSLDDLEMERAAAVETIKEMLDLMHVEAEVSGHLTEVDDLTGHQVNIIDVNGDDLSVLIGPRGGTLDSFQYISRLVVSHKLRRRANFVIDVEGYRKRREQALTRLAQHMADKVRQRSEAISLEPMPAFERRIIHMALRDAEDVYTESLGEGKQRRVRIFPKR
jgi:spoIIIJ-associated protein